MNNTVLKTGLAVGGGTGPELAQVFERALSLLGALHGIRMEVIRSPRIYQTYGPMAALSCLEVAQITRDDAAHYAAFVRELAASGVKICFRTALNAQSLYLVRDELMGVKVDPLPHAKGELLLIRDETQGFYSGRNDEPLDTDCIRRETVFSRENTWRVLDFALQTAARHWDREPIDHFVVACKFHLLDNRFAHWIRDYENKCGLRIHLYQPDTTNRQLLRGAFGGRTLLVGSNEWADIMHAELIERFGLGHQEERCTSNVYLHKDVEGFVEYQTVHGSADDIAGRGLVNPTSTLRAAAQVFEAVRLEYLSSPASGGNDGISTAPGIVAAMEVALVTAARHGIATPDAGGSAKTVDVTEAVLAALGEASAQLQSV